VNTHDSMRSALSPNLPLVRQREGNDCGPAALATVAAYHGCSFAYDHLTNQIALDRGGTDLLTLAMIARRIGLHAQGINASYDDLANCRLPAIAHVRHWFSGGHFVVIYRWTPTHLVLGDPAVGLRTISRTAFCRWSTGYLLIVQPTCPPAI
jgi:ABC-type bacteriocin/lantibiotic exporter with double-glycine peptidase domain